MIEAVQLNEEAASMATSKRVAEQCMDRQTAANERLETEVNEKEEALQMAQKRLKEATHLLDLERKAAEPSQLVLQRLRQQMQGLQVCIKTA